MPPAVVDDAGMVTAPATVNVDVSLIQVEYSPRKFRFSVDLTSLLMQVNEINDFKQYMDVTYIVEIEWKDHRIMNIGNSCK